MKKAALIALLALATLSLSSAPKEEKEPLKLLFLTHSAGYRHSVVTRPDPETLAHAERLLVESSKGRLEVDCTQDCSEINAENLERYDAVLRL